MVNDSIPRPDAGFQARRNNFVAHVNGHVAELGFPAGVMGGQDLAPGSAGISPAKLRPAPDRPCRVAKRGTEQDAPSARLAQPLS